MLVRQAVVPCTTCCRSRACNSAHRLLPAGENEGDEEEEEEMEKQRRRKMQKKNTDVTCHMLTQCSWHFDP